MPDIENYKRKKRRAFITLLVFSVFFLGILAYIGEDGVLLMVCVSLMLLWTNFFVRYEKLSTKIDIFEELQNKNDPKKDAPK